MAMLGTASALVVASFCFFTRYRWLIALVVTALLATTWWFSDPLLEYVMRLSGESRSLLYHTIEIDGQKLPHSSTMSRIHLFRLYRPALRQAGLFGYGTERTEGFPIKVPVGKGNEEALSMMPAVDNAYVLVAIRFGWLGVSALIAAVACFILNAFIATRHIRAQAERFFMACLGGSLLGTAIVCATVWMPHDFGFLLLWSGGVATSVRYAVERFANGSARKRVAVCDH
jgi:cell division protein FtsW (lipid II flippase)